MRDNKSNSHNRRKVLQGISAGAVSSLGLSETAMASKQSSRESDYIDTTDSDVETWISKQNDATYIYWYYPENDGAINIEEIPPHKNIKKITSDSVVTKDGETYVFSMDGPMIKRTKERMYLFDDCDAFGLKDHGAQTLSVETDSALSAFASGVLADAVCYLITKNPKVSHWCGGAVAAIFNYYNLGGVTEFTIGIWDWDHGYWVDKPWIHRGSGLKWDATPKEMMNEMGGLAARTTKQVPGAHISPWIAEQID